MDVLGAISFGFDKDPGDSGIFSTDETFKEELFSAQVVSDIMTAVKATKGDSGDYSPELCTSVSITLYVLMKETPEPAEAAYAHGGVDFATEVMEAYPAVESLLMTSITYIARMFHTHVPPEMLALAFLDKVLAAMEIHHDTCDDYFFLRCYCNVLCICWKNGYDMPLHVGASVVRFLWHGITKHRDDEEAQYMGREFLRALVGPEKALQMIDQAEMHQAEDDECAGCA